MKFSSKSALLGATAILFNLTACSSGGGDSTSTSTQTPKTGPISYTALTLQGGNVNEGEQVSFSLNPEGGDSDKLQFDWSVRDASGQELAFSGENTPSITFTAPQVDQDTVFNVSVKLSLPSGTLGGDDESSTAVRVVDLDAGEAPLFVKPDWPLVADFDVSVVTATSVWQADVYSNYPILGVGTADVRIESLLTFNEEIALAEDAAPTVAAAPGEQPQALMSYLNEHDDDLVVCYTGEPSEVRYQQGQNFRFEHKCDDRLVYAVQLRYSKEGALGSAGSVSLSYDNEENVAVSSDVYFATGTQRVLNSTSDDPKFSPSTKFVSFSAPYRDGRIQVRQTVQATSDDAMGIYFISGLELDSLNSAEIDSVALRLAEAEVDDGLMTIESWTGDSAKGSFDLRVNEPGGQLGKSLKASYDLKLQ